MRVHVLGVCGTFMGGVAQIASALGSEVEGSDAAFYEPMAGLLDAAGVKLHEGFDASCSDRPADLYVVGNVVRRGNPLFEDACRSGRPFASGPQWVADSFLSANDRVVAVAGTHGKTTTSAMAVHILEEAGLSPGYLVGGVLANGRSAAAGAGKVAVVEADEYDTALFDKRPKFTHYWADVTVLNNVEFDHADIYPDLDAVMRQFRLLPRHVRAGGTVVANWADANVREAVPDAPWHATVRTNDPGGWSVDGDAVRGPGGASFPLPALPPGRHVRDNFLAALAACEAVGVPPERSAEAMAGFRLPMRRMQVIHSGGGVTVIDDFAHHPTSIALTIEAAREALDGGELAVLFEPRSNTMRAGRWRGSLATSLRGADRVLALSDGLDWDLESELWPLGAKARVFGDAGKLEEAALGIASKGGVTLLMLSNGDFCGLRSSLPRKLAARGAG